MENKWKYIVYETTNLVNGKIYVGMHKTVNPDVWDHYLGNGVVSTQPYTYEHAKTAFQCAVKKYGPKNFIRKTLAVFNTEKEASDLEAQIVDEKFLEREDVYNMILGGFAGCLLSQRVKVYQYDTEGNFIAEYPSFAEAALKFNCDYTLISYAIRYKAKAKGFFWNTDKVEKLDLSNYNLGLNHSIAVHCYTVDGSYLSSYKTQQEAARMLNVSTSSIRESRLLGICVNNQYYFSTVKAESYSEARREYIETRTVYQYDSSGKYIREYAHQIEAELDNAGSNISKSIRLKTIDKNGYFWGLEKLENYNKPKKCNEKRKVGKYDLDGNLVQTYETATAAAKENGTSVWKVLSGTNKTQKGYVYKYLS